MSNNGKLLEYTVYTVYSTCSEAYKLGHFLVGILENRGLVPGKRSSMSLGGK